MQWFYNFIANLSVFILRIASFINPKLSAFYSVRKDWKKEITHWRNNLSDPRPVLCFHCASLGEYEMIIPIISNPEIHSKYVCVASFFSSSGYEYAKLDNGLTAKFYLPLDTKANMADFVQLLSPEIFVFVKYDFWFNLITELQRRGSRLFLVNGLLRPNQFVMSFWGKPLLKKIRRFEKLFVQNNESYKLLTNRGFDNAIETNDLRYDRVNQLKAQTIELDKIAVFKGDALTLIAGSSWPEEEEILVRFMESASDRIKLIIAPHDVGDRHVSNVLAAFSQFGVSLYTSGEAKLEDKVLIINTIGVLSSAYRYGDIAFIGGAFGKGLHNVLEAVSYGLPIITGPKTDKFPEASLLENEGILTKVTDASAFIYRMNEFMDDVNKRKRISAIADDWLTKNAGASKTISQHLLDD